MIPRRAKHILLALTAGTVCTLMLCVAWLLFVPDYSIAIRRAEAMLLRTRSQLEGADITVWVPASGPVSVREQSGEVASVEHLDQVAERFTSLTPQNKVLVVIDSEAAQERSPKAVGAFFGSSTKARLVFVVTVGPNEPVQ